MTLATERIEFVAREAAALGCRVDDEWDGSVRVVHVHGPTLLDLDSVIFRYTPAANGRRARLHVMEFSRRRYPRKGYAEVSYADGLFAAEMLKSYRAHTHCRMGRHVCQLPKCTAPRGDKPCGLPRSLHTGLEGHEFTS